MNDKKNNMYIKITYKTVPCMASCNARSVKVVGQLPLIACHKAIAIGNTSYSIFFTEPALHYASLACWDVCHIVRQR